MSANIFTAATLGGLKLRNRIIRAGCFEGMCQDGKVTEQLIEHHRRLAQGGVAMTTVAYCSVSFDGRAFDHEMWMHNELVPDLKRLTGAVHREGAAASIQLGHCGYFANKKVIRKRPLGASRKYNLFQQSYCRSMTKEDIEEKTRDFVQAALLAREAGFDAIELHAGHGYLLSQFMSPFTNKRQDEYGGSLANRMRFPVDIICRIRSALSDEFPILVKMNIRDGMKGGLESDEAVMAAKLFEAAGASALIPSSGFTSKTPFYMLRGNLPIKEMVRNQKNYLNKFGLMLFGRFMVQEYDFKKMFLLDGANKIRESISIPVIYIGGAVSKPDMTKAIDAGFSFVQIGRASIRNPDFVNHLAEGLITESDCDHCNRCVAAMDAGGVYCVSAELGLMKEK
jgi:2,4-dienoyl-CoA reductase-like NADH-dependent reductase (Old Yellow Enzyme family)